MPDLGEGSEHPTGDGKFGHMSTPNGQPRRPGFMESLKTSFIPKPVEFDSNEPNVLPTTVKVAGWLAIVGGLLNLSSGGILLASKDGLIEAAIDQVQECNDVVGGTGTNVTGTEPTDLVTLCKTFQNDITPAIIRDADSRFLTMAIIGLVIGVALVASGYMLSKGKRWARRVVSSIALLLVLMVFLSLIYDLLTLGSAVLLVIGLAMVYVGKGATYFVRAKAEGQN